jgi:virulence factor
MLRIGIVDCDTSHVYQFSRRLNHRDIEPNQWVDGAQVTAAYVGTSRVTAPERVEEYVTAMQAAGVDLVASPTDLIGQVDAVFVESNEGGVHLERAMPFIEAGLPVFIDKPLATTTRDARTLVEMAARAGSPLISASSLRFVPEIAAARNDAGVGPLHGADVYAPARLHDVNPGLFHYGVHGVEMLFALLGPGCREVSCVANPDGEVVTGLWGDGRLGVMRGLRTGPMAYGFTAFGSEGIRAYSLDTASIYRDLLSAIVPVLAGAPSPISNEELVEVVAFQEAALESSRIGGQPVALAL